MLKSLDVSKTNISDISFLEKNKNIIILNLSYCHNIKDFNLISKLQSFEHLDVSFTDISGISILEKNKNIKQLNLFGCTNIKDFTL